MEGIDTSIFSLPILGPVQDLSPLPDPSEVTYWQNRGSRIFTIDYELEDNYAVMDLQKAILQIQKKYGKNSILKGTSLQEGATGRERNKQIGGHKA